MKNRKIRFLSAEDIEETLSMAEAIRAVKEASPELAFHLLPVNRGKALEGTGWPASSRRRASAEASGLKGAMNTNKEETG